MVWYSLHNANLIGDGCCSLLVLAVDDLHHQLLLHVFFVEGTDHPSIRTLANHISLLKRDKER